MSDDAEFGAVWPPVREDPPAGARRGPRNKMGDLRAWLEQQSDAGPFRIGTYRSPQAPRGQYAEYGIEVTQVKVAEGVYARYATLAKDSEASITPLRPAENS